MMRLRIAAMCMSLTLLTVSAFAASLLAPHVRHYDLRHDLSVAFSNSDAVIDFIRRSMRSRDESIIISYRSHGDNMADIGTLVRELMTCAFSETDNPAEGDYLYHQTGGYEMQYSYQREDDAYAYVIRITPDYYTDAEQEAAVDRHIAALTEEWNLPRHATDYEVVQRVTQYVTDRVAYDRIHLKNEHYHLKSTAYGALINGAALCQGYAVTVYRLLRECGVSCRVITGLSENAQGEQEPHAWNLVCIDGLWYNLDVTWDDQAQSDDFFLCGATDFPKHQPDELYRDAAFCAAYPIAETRYQGGN